ncbi:DMT family transporter [Proteus vulgaris]|uniref:DMT family transporter n=1 Tax=Proteus vulgaris TaxID=585 RepID=UPI002874F94E|nr:DMT family transporter [Proteus vulgaris]MDS0788463.1 DMT family transporter [Proteus vulgaris]
MIIFFQCCVGSRYEHQTALLRNQQIALSCEEDFFYQDKLHKGAFTVLLAAITVNSSLSLSDSIILMITGQILFSVIVDAMGWFGVEKRKIILRDLFMCFLLISGSTLLIIDR